MKKDNKPDTITATELKSNLGKYLDYVCEDNEVVITKKRKKNHPPDALYYRHRKVSYRKGKRPWITNTAVRRCPMTSLWRSTRKAT